MIRLITTEVDLKKYREWVHSHPQGSLWQSLERKRYLEACGKTVRIYVAGDEQKTIVASALVSIDRTTGGFSTWEIARGPLVSEKLKVESGKYQEFLNLIVADAKKEKCIALYLSPTEKIVAFNFPLSTSRRRIHAEATRILDLTQSEDQLLAGMHSKGRYNIGVAKKHGVEIHQGSAKDIDAFYALLKSTGGRDGFKILQKSHYERFLTNLKGSFILMAKHQGKPIAGLIGVMWPPSSSPTLLHCGGEGSHTRTGIYYYGASSYEHRHLMAPYLLQWEAIRHCKATGCVRYDLLGISPEGSGSNDPWAGITEFKSKFGGEVIMYPKEQMIVLRPMMKKLLEWKRRIVG